jgi:YidC/Oxa1 family membrane protein insertase
MWSALVELVRATIFVAAHLVGGSLGAAVVLVSAGVRLALLPLTLRAARQARAQQEKINALRPQLERLNVRYAQHPWKLYTETQALYRRNGIQSFGGAGVSTLIQLPLLGALFAAVRSGLGVGVRFLWIDNLSRANGVLLLLVAGMSAAAASVAPTTPGSAITPRVMSLLAAGATLAFLWSASSTVALSVGAGSAVSALQNWLLRRESRTRAATG